MNLNTVTLTGNLTRDPESFADGKVASFGLAVNGREKKGDEWVDRTEFVDVTCFGRTAENVCKYLSKGSAVAIDGRLRFEQWEKDGEKRSKLKVVADQVEFVGPKKDSDSSNGGNTDSGSSGDGGAAPDDSDIPFARPVVPNREVRRRDLFVGDRSWA